MNKEQVRAIMREEIVKAFDGLARSAEGSELGYYGPEGDALRMIRDEARLVAARFTPEPQDPFAALCGRCGGTAVDPEHSGSESYGDGTLRQVPEQCAGCQGSEPQDPFTVPASAAKEWAAKIRAAIEQAEDAGMAVYITSEGDGIYCGPKGSPGRDHVMVWEEDDA